MSKSSCPHCGGCLAASKLNAKNAVQTIIRDGAIWYGTLVNYTTGPRLAYATFQAKNKDHRKPWVRELANLRAHGKITAPRDWLCDYPHIFYAMQKQGFIL